MLSSLRKILCKISKKIRTEQITPLEQKKLHLSLSEFQNRRNYTFRTEKTTPLVINAPLIKRKYSKHAIYFYSTSIAFHCRPLLVKSRLNF